MTLYVSSRLARALMRYLAGMNWQILPTKQGEPLLGPGPALLYEEREEAPVSGQEYVIETIETLGRRTVTSSYHVSLHACTC